MEKDCVLYEVRAQAKEKVEDNKIPDSNAGAC
jgi:hypothetical protein